MDFNLRYNWPFLRLAHEFYCFQYQLTQYCFYCCNGCYWCSS